MLQARQKTEVKQGENTKAADRDEDTHHFSESLLLIEFYMLGIRRRRENRKSLIIRLTLG